MRRVRPETVLVTGASSGLGRALAIEYAKRGARVAVVARREAELASLCDQIERTGGDARPFSCDVADSSAVTSVVHRAERELGSLHTVIANAGIGAAKHSSRLTVDDVTHVVDVNVRGAMATLVAAIPILMAQTTGHLVGVTSLAGRRALPGASAYNASKAALSSFLETLRIDLEPAGIRVTDVQPGFVDTPMLRGTKHPTPFLWGAPKAARYIADRLERGPRLIAFPLPLDLLTRFSRHVPYALYARLTRRVANAAG